MIFFIRYIGALLYDTITVLALLFILTGIIVLFNRGQAVPPETPWYQFILVCGALLYYYSSMKFGGQTLGMRAWRLKLVGLTQQRLSTPQILARILCFLPAILIAPFYFTGNYTLLNRWTKTDFIMNGSALRTIP
ncbi:RDD family protein [Legionella maioricensis]|uniref:RDD family protein n=1 Tax=Legionella maioricensis TaxID=2896528 RepID=A0A9X2D2B4_9GAMM|nr:RDD family protein [Legionella maioricensis]MCL9685239.1 RDD family protein [Legionella maioricensis]MCL9688456.1 RDD family protein [Legionella maioricensis]